MSFSFTGIAGWIIGLCIGTTAFVAVLLGIWYIWNLFLWEILIGSAFRMLRLHKTFVIFIYYNQRIMQWIKETKEKEKRENEQG